MKLLRLSLENFRGAPNGSWAFTAPGSAAPFDAVYVTGPAACGKTSFLEAIAALKESVGAYGAPPNGAALRRRGAKSGRVEGTWLLSPDEMARADAAQAEWTTALDLGDDVVAAPAAAGLRALFEGYDHDPARGKVEYFPANRCLSRGLGMAPVELEAEARLRLAADPDKYASIHRALVDLALGDGLKAVEEAMARGVILRHEQRDSLAAYRRDLAELAPGIRLGGVRRDGEEAVLGFLRADGVELGVDDLSESERQALLFCATFRRVGLSRSIVLVDTPELHVHADAQVRFVQAIGRLGVDNQIFYATGSSEIAAAAPSRQIVDLGKAGRR